MDFKIVKQMLLSYLKIHFFCVSVRKLSLGIYPDVLSNMLKLSKKVIEGELYVKHVRNASLWTA